MIFEEKQQRAVRLRLSPPPMRIVQGGAKSCVGIPEMFWPPDIDAVSPKMRAVAATTAAGADEEQQVSVQ